MATLLFFRRKEISNKTLYMLRALVPSWRFFDFYGRKLILEIGIPKVLSSAEFLTAEDLKFSLPREGLAKADSIFLGPSGKKSTMEFRLKDMTDLHVPLNAKADGWLRIDFAHQYRKSSLVWNPTGNMYMACENALEHFVQDLAQLKFSPQSSTKDLPESLQELGSYKIIQNLANYIGGQLGLSRNSFPSVKTVESGESHTKVRKGNLDGQGLLVDGEFLSKDQPAVDDISFRIFAQDGLGKLIPLFDSLHFHKENQSARS